MKCFFLLNFSVVTWISLLGPTPGNSETSSSVPDILQACYRTNFTVTSRPPLTMPILIEMLRKVELSQTYSINTRILSTSMLHGIVFDGIQRTPGLIVDDALAIPYAATLNKFHKFKVIVDYLISGQITQFPLETLTLDELCFLHRLTSNTIDRFERGDEENTCQDSTFMPSETAALNSNAPLSSCPLKLGNIKTKWGTVSASHLIAGIAAGLQQNQVTFQRVFDAIRMHKGGRKGSYKMPSNSNDTSQEVDSILFASITGDLGEVVLTQASKNPVIGNQGNWNDTLLPRAFYLRSQQWDLTEAEILGGIDAAVIGKKAAFLLNILDSTRLSQLLDMYYSERGIPYQFNLRVTNRVQALDYLFENINFSNQIYGSTKLLQVIRGTYTLTLTDAYIQQLSGLYADIYRNTSFSIANNYDRIEYVTGNRLLAPLEVIVILDGTFDSYSTQQLIYALSEAIEVSPYGSRLGIVNGQTGLWITNVTRENFAIFQSFQQLVQHGTWPVTLSLGQSLETVIGYYQNRTQTDCNAKVMNPIGQAIVVLSKDGRLTDSDHTRTTRSIESIKQSYPETVIIYVSQDVNGVLKELSQNDDDYLVNPSTDVLSTVTKIVEKLSVIPGSLIKFYCNHSDVRFEHYFTPGEENVFQIHREYVKRGFVTTKFMNKDYGDLSICLFTSRTSRNNRLCQPLTVNGEISFNSGSLCTPDSACDLQYSLTANNSHIKCAETDCRYPDQVLVIITYEYSSGAPSLMSSFSIFTVLATILHYT